MLVRIFKMIATSGYLAALECTTLHSLSLTKNKCKKHSLSHQLTAQLLIENSKNKKMVITLLQHIA